MSSSARRRSWIVLSSAGLAAAVAGVTWWYRDNERLQARSEAVPSIPAVQAWPAEFRQRLDASTRRVGVRSESAVALSELAALYHANGFLDEARRCYEGLELSGDADATSLYRHALILAGYGDAAPASAALQRVIQLAPDYLPAHLRLGDLRLKQGDVDGAAEAFGRAIALDAGNPYANLGLARCEIDRENWSAARRFLETVTTATNHRLGYDLIVTVYERLGLKDEASRERARTKAQGTYRDMADPWMEALQSESFDPSQLALAATSLKEAGDSGRAQMLLERALRFAPQDAKLHFQVGLMLKEQRNYAGARTHFEKCTSLDPTFADGWVHLWDALSALGLQDQARAAFATGLRHCPESYGMNLMRARELKAAGMLRESLSWFEKVIRLRPMEPDAYIDLALTQLALGEEDAGVKTFGRALQAEPGHPVALTALAFHAIQSGEPAEAARWLRLCQDQPRVSKEDLHQLVQLYRERFPGR